MATVTPQKFFQGTKCNDHGNILERVSNFTMTILVFAFSMAQMPPLALMCGCPRYSGIIRLSLAAFYKKTDIPVSQSLTQADQ